jgi:hypothetical protein
VYHFDCSSIWRKQILCILPQESNLGIVVAANLDVDPPEADDSHDVFMIDDGETPPEDMSNGTVVWA